MPAIYATPRVEEVSDAQGVSSMIGTVTVGHAVLSGLLLPFIVREVSSAVEVHEGARFVSCGSRLFRISAQPETGVVEFTTSWIRNHSTPALLVVQPVIRTAPAELADAINAAIEKWLPVISPIELRLAKQDAQIAELRGLYEACLGDLHELTKLRATAFNDNHDHDLSERIHKLELARSLEQAKPTSWLRRILTSPDEYYSRTELAARGFVD